MHFAAFFPSLLLETESNSPSGVVHFVMNPTAGSAQIPPLLAGQSAPSDSSLGSKNYSVPPVAVILGGGYDDAGIEQMMTATAGNSSAKHVPWLRPDLTIPAPPLGPEYGKAMVQRVKAAMTEIQTKGEMNETKVHWY